MRLREKIAVVTGAGRGIGRAIAHTFAKEGALVGLVARSTHELEAVRLEIERDGGTAFVFPADLTQDAEVAQVFTQVATRFKRLDILVNNAGIGRFATVKELSVDDFDAMWKVNMRGLFLCTQNAVRVMEAQKSGVIVNVSSLAGKNAFVHGAGYAATKWALMGFSRCLMLEVRQHNVRVITICPGSVDTGFSPRNASKNAGKLIQPQDVADTILAAITLPDRSMVSEIDIRPTNPK
jgi:3-oxoacyl-[acyl-carrier protein] reductase